MSEVEYQRRDDRTDIEVMVHCLEMRVAELEGCERTWAGRGNSDLSLRARPAADKAIAAARVIAGLGHDIAAFANAAVERLQLETEEHDIERGALVPGDDIRRWPDVV